jgi:SAM-dependent methyltransferase
MQSLIGALDRDERAFLSGLTRSVLDWGCATGDGVGELSRAFPGCTVSGLDVSAVAVETARKRFPGHEFIVGGNSGLPRRFDVIVTSNCLEHFSDPMSWLGKLAIACDDLLLVLVPDSEWPLMETHRSSLSARTFPAFVGGLVRVRTQVVKTDPAHWAGRQLLVVYGTRRFMEWRRQRAGWRAWLSRGLWRARQYYSAQEARRSHLDIRALEDAARHLRSRQ